MKEKRREARGRTREGGGRRDAERGRRDEEEGEEGDRRLEKERSWSNENVGRKKREAGSIRKEEDG
jgi:hypothetical protein